MKAIHNIHFYLKKEKKKISNSFGSLTRDTQKMILQSFSGKEKSENVYVLLDFFLFILDWAFFYFFNQKTKNFPSFFLKEQQELYHELIQVMCSLLRNEYYLDSFFVYPRDFSERSLHILKYKVLIEKEIFDVLDDVIFPLYKWEKIASLLSISESVDNNNFLKVIEKYKEKILTLDSKTLKELKKIIKEQKQSDKITFSQYQKGLLQIENMLISSKGNQKSGKKLKINNFSCKQDNKKKGEGSKKDILNKQNVLGYQQLNILFSPYIHEYYLFIQSTHQEFIQKNFQERCNVIQSYWQKIREQGASLEKILESLLEKLRFSDDKIERQIFETWENMTEYVNDKVIFLERDPNLIPWAAKLETWQRHLQQLFLYLDKILFYTHTLK